MAYCLEYTAQFKKDYKLAKKAAGIWASLRKCCAVFVRAAHFRKRCGIISSSATIAVIGSAISNLIGCSSIASMALVSFSLRCVLARTLTSSASRTKPTVL